MALVNAELATNEEIEFAYSENPIFDFVEAQYHMLKSARVVTGTDIQNPQQLFDYVLEHLELVGQLSEDLKDSDYLEINKLEGILNP